MSSGHQPELVSVPIRAEVGSGSGVVSRDPRRRSACEIPIGVLPSWWFGYQFGLVQEGLVVEKAQKTKAANRIESNPRFG